MKIKLLSICMLSGLVVACSDEIINDVQYYLDNPNLRAEKIAECSNNPGENAVSPNCLNAREAEKQVMLSGSNMPTIR